VADVTPEASDDMIAVRARLHDVIDSKAADALKRGASADDVVQAMSQAREDSADIIVETLLEKQPGMIEDHEAIHDDVERIIRETWGEALDRLFAVIVGTDELLRGWANANVDAAADAEDQLWGAVSGLAATALRTSFEGHRLLRHGFPDGAAARARSLHELAVVVRVLVEHDDLDLAARFWDHQLVDQLDYVRKHNKHAAALGRLPMPAEQTELEAIVTQLRVTHGEGFHRPNGWALPALGRTDGGVSFADLEAIAGLDHWRPDYKIGSLKVHPTAWHSVLSMEKNGHVTSWRLTGLCEPGTAMLASLGLIAADAVARGSRSEPNQFDLLGAVALQKLSEVTAWALLDAESNAERREATEQLRPPARWVRRPGTGEPPTP